MDGLIQRSSELITWKTSCFNGDRIYILPLPAKIRKNSSVTPLHFDTLQAF